MARRVFVTGGSGFVGSAVVEDLISRDYSVTALVHRREIKTAGVKPLSLDLFDSKGIEKAIFGFDAVIHLVAIIDERPAHGITFERINYEATRSVVDAAKGAKVRRFVHMSALGARPNAVSGYHQTKYRAEEYVRSSGLDWTIFRPSIIHGPRGEFMQMVAGWAKRRKPPFLFMPYFGAGAFGRGGAGMIQPIYVKDVARAFADALEKPETIGETYLLGGADRLTWPQFHQIASSAIVGKQRWTLAMPVWKAKALTYLVPAALLPFNRDQVIMSQEDNTCDLSKFEADFGWTPGPFEPALREYAGQI